jgi:hypothetical protein
VVTAPTKRERVVQDRKQDAVPDRLLQSGAEIDELARCDW